MNVKYTIGQILTSVGVGGSTVCTSEGRIDSILACLCHKKNLYIICLYIISEFRFEFVSHATFMTALHKLGGAAHALSRCVSVFFFLVYSHINILHASLENFLVRFSYS